MLSPNICQQARLTRDPRFDGLFFILVRTTKIFCRNTCKVRMPLEKNVSYASSAQLALAQGYRPCLRCRPDSAPQSCAWQGTHTTVNRAMKLLAQRLEQSVEDIAESLGISSRYLHKLFNTHLQISPKRYRLYQQVLMAKNLLQQTTIPIEQVAHCVGFSSARQLQQHVKAQLKLTPSQIRKNKVATQAGKNMLAKLSTHNNVDIFLSYRPPYNWLQVKGFFARRAIIGNEEVHDTGFTKVLSIHSENSIVAVKISVEHVPTKQGFTLRFDADFSQYSLRIISIVKRMLDLDADPITIQSALKNTGLQAQDLVEGLRVPGVASAFEAGCRAILGQQVSVSAAVNKVNELYQHFAQDTQSVFPQAKDVANDDLMFLKMPARRRQTLIDLATYFAEHDPSDNDYQVLDGEALLNIKGIGPWTLNYIEMRASGNTDVYLDGDLIVKQQIAKFAANKQVLQPQLAAPWRSYLTLNLWSLST